MASGPAHQGLIESLVADLRPVRRVPSPAAMTAVFLGSALLVGLGMWLSSRLGGVAAASASTVSNALVLAPGMAAAAAALAAFELSRPDRSRFWSLLPAPAIVLWTSLVAWQSAAASPGQSWGQTWQDALQCFLCISLSALPLAVLALWLLRSAHPLQPGLTASMAGLACAAAGTAILGFVHPHSSTLLDHMMHLAAIGTVILLSWTIGRLALA